MARILTIRPAHVYKRPLGVTLNVSDTFYHYSQLIRID
jgi:hypothetical protein